MKKWYPYRDPLWSAAYHGNYSHKFWRLLRNTSEGWAWIVATKKAPWFYELVPVRFHIDSDVWPSGPMTIDVYVDLKRASRYIIHKHHRLGQVRYNSYYRIAEKLGIGKYLYGHSVELGYRVFRTKREAIKYGP